MLKKLFKLKFKEPKGSWDFLILLLSIFAILTFPFEFIFDEDTEILFLLRLGDIIVCFFFLIDVFWRFMSSKDKIGFWKYGWIDLLASIPTLEYLRPFRIFRVFRIIRTIRSFNRVKTYFFSSKVKGTATFLLALLFTTVIASSLLILHFEGSSGSIKTAQDALWWSITTIATVGYGDLYPMTAYGRVVATFVMFVGITLFSASSALFASFLINNTNYKKSEVDIDKRFNDLEESLKRLENDINKSK